MVTLSGEGFVSEVTGCRLGSSSSVVMAQVFVQSVRCLYLSAGVCVCSCVPQCLSNAALDSVPLSLNTVPWLCVLNIALLN